MASAIIGLSILSAWLPACARPAAPTAGDAVPIDSSRAFLKLADIQPAPSLPPAAPERKTEPVEAAQRYLRQARERFDEQLWADAISALEKFLQLDPDRAEARVLLARAAMRQGNMSLAETHLKDVLHAEPRNVAAHQMLGEIAWQEHRTGQAIESLRLALVASEDTPHRPERVLAHLTLAMALRKEGYLSAAVDELEAYLAATEKPGPEISTYRELAEIMVLYRGRAAGLIGEIQTQLGRHELAAKAYERAVEQSPNENSLRVRLAQSLARAGRGDAALNVVRRLTEERPDDPAILPLLKEVCDLTKQPQRFDAELIQFARTVNSPVLRMQLADMLLARDKIDAAMEALQAVTREDAANVKAHCLLAKLHFRKQDPRRAVLLLAGILHEHPTSTSDVEAVLKAPELSASRETKNAVTALLTERPQDPAVHFLYGDILEASGQLEGATEQFQAAADKEFGPASAALARMWARQKKWTNVIEAAQDAIRGGVTDGEVYLLKGKAYLALDDNDNAETALLEAFRQNPKSAEPLYLLAESAEQRGEKKRCEQLYKRILDDVDPHHIPARERLIMFYLNNEKLEKAKDYFSDFDRFGQTGPAVERCQAYMNLASRTDTSGQARIDKLRTELKTIAHKYPRDIASQLELTALGFKLSDFDAALASAEAALTIDPTDLKARALKASILAKLLDYEGSARIFRELTSERPRDSNYRRSLVDLSLNQADWRTAAELLESLAAAEQNKEVKDFLMRQWIECLIIAGRADEAVAHAKEWLDNSPAEATRRDAYLTALQAAQKSDKAIEAAAKWLADDPTSSALRAQYFSQLDEADRLTDAQQKVLSWLSHDAEDVVLNGMLIYLFRRQKDWDSAIEIAQTGAELSEHRNQYHSWLGQIYRDAGRFDEAETHYRAQFKAQSTRESALELMQVLVAARRWNEAEKLANSLLAGQAARREAGDEYDRETVLLMRRQLANVYQETGREKAALDALEEFLKMLPQNPGINNDLGYSWVEEGMNLDQAEKMIRFAVREQPRTGAYLDSLGWTLYKRGKIKEGLVWLDRAIRMIPYEQRGMTREERLLRNMEDPVLYDHLADALYRDGQRDRAADCWKKARMLVQAKKKEDDTRELKKLRLTLDTKLKQIGSDEPADVAPLAAPAGATSQPDSVLGAR